MPRRAGATAVDDGPRLSPGLWIASAIEIAVALGVSTIALRAGHPAPISDVHGSDMAGMHTQRFVEISWHAATFMIAIFTAAALIWWLATRARAPAILAAAGLVGLGVSTPLRMMAVRSHLVGMAVLEVLLVAVPLLLVAAAPRRGPSAGSRRSATAWLFVAVLANSALLIALHLPAVHDLGARLDRVPLWLPIVVVAVGSGYWAAILLTARHISAAVRRGALIIGQEVGAILGLATLLASGPHLRHATAFGVSATLDQRLGGALMLITCAAVTLPLAKQLDPQHLRMEHNVP